uniref:Uncharacterized protein n=1 Tax=Arundo donax TaxID=35708 RepID=A0A0A9AKF2_ARUDO
MVTPIPWNNLVMVTGYLLSQEVETKTLSMEAIIDSCLLFAHVYALLETRWFKLSKPLH